MMARPMSRTRAGAFIPLCSRTREEMMVMRSTVLSALIALVLSTGCSPSPQTAAVPDPVMQHLARPLDYAVPYDVDASSRLGAFLVARGFYVPWINDSSVRYYDHELRLNSYTTLPNGTNAPYTLAEKARPFVRGTNLQIATYRVEKVLSFKMKKPPKAVRGKVERYVLKVQVRVDPLMPGMPPVRSLTASVDVDYDSASGTVLKVDGLAGLAKTIGKEIDGSLKGGR